MTQRAAADPTVREFEAEVVAVDGRDVALDETYFYAESGGQPADSGSLGGVDVVDVRKREYSRGGEAVEGTVHTLTEEPDFAVGDTVAGIVDDEFRTYTMRSHTASHMLYGAGRRLLDELGYGGFDIGTEKVRVDFTTTTDIDDDVLAELERLVNRAVWDSRDVTWEEVPADEAREREDVAFNTKTEEGVMADADDVRVVTIDGWDVAACGGTHVSNTAEIGPIEVLDRSNPGEGMTRVEFAVGPEAIDHRAAVRRATDAAAREFGTNVADLADRARQLREERDDLEADLRELRTEALTSCLESLDAIDRDGESWRVGVVDGFGPNEVGDRLKELAGDAGDVLVVAGEQGSTFVVVAAADGVDTDAGAVVADVTDEFGGGGGGGPTFAQGGGIGTSPIDVVTFVRD